MNTKQQCGSYDKVKRAKWVTTNWAKCQILSKENDVVLILGIEKNLPVCALST